MRIVLDASTALSAVLPGGDPAYADAAIDAAMHDGFLVPSLWHYEVQNGLNMAFRHERIDIRTLEKALDSLRALRAALISPGKLGQELHLATVNGVSTYDAAYLTVALQHGIPIATNDKRLRDAARKTGIAIFAATSA